MADLTTVYMGLKLRNPIVVSSSSLVNTPEGVQKCADAGAGAVVLKSLFEEQIQADERVLEQHSLLFEHPEAFDLVERMSMELGPREYLQLVEKAKKAVSIPVVASLNCVSPKWWNDYAKQIAGAGADALELNIAILPSDPKRQGREIEDLCVRIVEDVWQSVKIPISVKMGAQFTSVAAMAARLCSRGAAALVLFNRFYQFDISVDTLKPIGANRLSTPAEMYQSLRWIALLSGKIDCDLAASTGIHDGVGVIKQLLAGATAVYLCSSLYLHKLDQIRKILSEVESWMTDKGFGSVSDFRGKLSQMQSDEPELFERMQYIKALVGVA